MLRTDANADSVSESAPNTRQSMRPLTMPEQIAENITDAVLRGEYKPGDRVREQDLAEQYQVSRGPIREALRILEKSGLVRIVPQRGAHITQLSVKEVSDMFEIRRVLAGLLARSLCPAPASLIKALDTEVSKIESLIGRKDGLNEHAKASVRISRLMFEACKNRQLVEMMESLVNQTVRYTRLGLAEVQRRRESAADWRAFVTALDAGDADLAATVLEGLIEASRLAAMKQLQQTG